MQSPSGKFCPACKRYNEPGAIFCVHCGAPFEDAHLRPVTTTRFGMPESAEPEVAARRWSPQILPDTGIAFFFPEDQMPFEICPEDEFLIGRKTDDSPEYMLDLAIYDAFGHGVSRRHARVRRTPEGYEITDLESTNGTWVNEQRLAPHQPQFLPSGAMLRLGRMRMMVAYKK
ncbi:MAG: FHA domain-containing protein [Anaerolineales bacterium]|nr:FHA domain-containing protein [Anaerolineales bacterium]MCX7754267.1 FHA domain-containing protein [Anaerolineales bacterium]MDW8276658.1 FHA domain-containing protein [Anaerolineales bacterium]